MKYESTDPHAWPATMRPSLDAAMERAAVETLLAEHFSPIACVEAGHFARDESMVAAYCAHLAAALEPLIREREAKALEDAADDYTSPASRSAYLTIEARRWLRTRAATHREPRP